MARALVSVIVVAVVFAVATPISYSIPFILVHGLTGQCESPDPFIGNLSAWSGSPGCCIEVGDGKCDSAFMSLEKQTNILCQKVKEMEELKEGYNIVATSQFSQQLICSSFAESVKRWVYTDCLQDRLAPSGYLKIPTAIPEYLKGSKFLPKLNNERPNERNPTYKERFSSLNTLVLIMAENDTVLIPKETSWFGYYQDGGFATVLPPQKVLQ
ncbi:hypothetical protein J5N97_029701 [Dioscorea zingiberensis]|uniref:Uncharacterized protein n=1 Tax=Dioscorea zingiberensis TaxID=325984 RepID=A0A9D5BW94_9LILI|nr:hypothetical protein J5N97_029701 [Dioscorea zingiberensis]